MRYCIVSKMWIALFSRSGSEIVKLSKAVGREPDIVLTNNSEQSTWYPGASDLNVTVHTHDEIMNILRFYRRSHVTLHGYLRILPADVTEYHNVYNGHPGDIIKYEELKGKDPQEKAFNLKHRTVGCVIHRVNSKVDDGEIVEHRGNIPVDFDLDSYYNVLSIEQLKLWESFYGKYLRS